MNKPPVPAVPMTMSIGWALGTLCSTLLLFVTNTFYLRFMTDYVGLSAAVAGGLLASMKFFEMVSNPVTGIITDNMPTWFGRRRPFLLIGSVIGALGLLLMFSVPAGLTPGMDKAYIFGALVVSSIGYTLYNVPYLAMLAEMTSDTVERARLVSYRVYVLAIGQFAAGGVAPLIVHSLGGDRAAYSEMAGLVGILVILFGLISFLATRGATETVMSREAKSHFFPELVTLLRSPFYRSLLLVKATALIGASAHTVAATFYVHYVLHASDKTLSAFLFAYSGGIVLSQYVWVRAAARFGKIQAYVTAAMLYTLISIVWGCMIDGVPIWAIIALSLLNGSGAGGILLITEAMLPDAIEDDFHTSGVRREGTLAAGFAFAEKAANAAGVALVGAVLAWFGYKGMVGHGAATAGTVLSPTALRGVMFSFGMMPAFFAAISCLWFLDVRRRRTMAA